MVLHNYTIVLQIKFTASGVFEALRRNFRGRSYEAAAKTRFPIHLSIKKELTP